MKSEQKCITVYVPDTLENNNVGFLPGFIYKDGYDIKFYINDNRLRNESTGCIGYCGLAQIHPYIQPKYWIRVSFSDRKFQVCHILCDQIQEYSLLYVFYDFEAFKRSHLISSYLKPNNEFYYLSKSQSSNNLLKKQYNYFSSVLRYFICILTNITTLCHKLTKIKPLCYLSTFQHMDNTCAYIDHILNEIYRKGTLSIEINNFLVTKIIDIILGILLIDWLISYRNLPMEHIETLINYIGDLLCFLMGSPVGLKLNAAFNKTLGYFFLYHITLWNTFLKTTALNVNMGKFGEFLLTAVCSLGLTQQLAVASDILALCTFHVHCIYVYAARLYGTQIYALTALWKLFLGRKRNPLKKRVDTYKYSSRQLFVGTLAFTVLLFLLPTTALYYLVFVTFRLILTTISNILSLLRKVLLRAPIFLTLLWLLNSSKIKTQVHITARPSSGALALDATLKAGLWRTCCLEPKFTLPVATSKPKKSSLFVKIVYGDLI